MSGRTNPLRSRPANSSLLEGSLLLIGAVVAAIYFTYPLAFRLDSLGRTNSRDGAFSIWNVAWVAHAILSPADRVLDANIFQPRPGTLTYSEANLGAGVLAVPFYMATGDGLAAHNGAVLLGFVLSGLATYGLARRLTGSSGAASVAAVLYTYCPYIFARTAHVQLMMIWVLPACLLTFHRFVDGPSIGRAAVLGATLAVAALFCAYYGVLAGLVVGAGVVFYALTRGHWRRWTYWALAAGAAALSGALVWPLFRQYLALQDAGFSRSLEEAAVYSADWQAYFASSASAHDWMLAHLGHWNEVLFPGFLALGLGLTGVWAGLRRARTSDGRGQASPSPALRETTLFYGLLLALAFWASFGPSAGLYTVLFETLPVFSFLRAPARFGIAVSMSLAVLAAIALTLYLDRVRRGRVAVVIVCLALAALDLRTPTPLVPTPPPDPVYAVLATLPRGQVVELPFFYRVPDYNRHAEYMFNSTYHWQPLVNGYSDFIPQDFKDMALLMASFPNPEGFQFMYDRHGRYAVFHPYLYNEENRQTLYNQLDRYAPYLKLLSKSNDALLYQIVGWPTSVTRRAPVGAAGPASAQP